MVGIRIDGKIIAQSVKDRVKKAADELKNQGISPCLATVLIGDNPASATYVRNKHKACEEVGIATKDHKLDSNITQSELSKIIDELNADKSVHGILVQLPLPKQLDEFATTSRISPIKDVDGYKDNRYGNRHDVKERRCFKRHVAKHNRLVAFRLPSDHGGETANRETGKEYKPYSDNEGHLRHTKFQCDIECNGSNQNGKCASRICSRPEKTE